MPSPKCSFVRQCFVGAALRAARFPIFRNPAKKRVATEYHPPNSDRACRGVTRPGGSRVGENVLRYSEEGGVLTFQVRVVPRASRSEIAGEHDGALRIRVTAPPVEGAANEEVIRLLARALGVTRSAVEIVAGHTSKLKRVKVRGARPSDLRSLTP
jgi:uncharacterized protein (TIGR00251 family)